MPSAPFNEMSTLTDVEVDDLIADLRFKIREKKRECDGIVSLTYNHFIRKDFKSEWAVCANIEGEYIVGSDKLLHVAFNNLLDKIKPPLDCLAYLGFVDHPLEKSNGI